MSAIPKQTVTAFALSTETVGFARNTSITHHFSASARLAVASYHADLDLARRRTLDRAVSKRLLREQAADKGPRFGPRATSEANSPTPCGHFRTYELQSLGFEQTHIHIVFKTSRDHLLIQDLSGLSIEISGIASRKTAAHLNPYHPIPSRLIYHHRISSRTRSHQPCHIVAAKYSHILS